MKVIYFNTTGADSQQLDLCTEINKKQNREVLDIARQQIYFTASSIHRFMLPKKGVKPPITSVRRALNTLEFKDRLIRKTGEKRCGVYGRYENIYTLVNHT